MDKFTPSVDAIANSLTLSAIVGFIPLIVFFVMLGACKIKTHWCALGSLLVSVLIAMFGFKMPTTLALLSASQGALFGFFPILYIVIMAVWLYNLTQATGREKDVQTVFSLVGKGDMRVQALLIGYAFCGLLEGLAGFGAPVAITCAMLYALGLPPIKAAIAVIVGNALNVGFGAMAIPTTTVAGLGSVAPEVVGATMGRVAPLLIFFVPFLLLLILDGVRGLTQIWPAAFAAGFSMACGQFIAANYLSYELTAVFASLLSFAALAGFMRIWTPRTPADFQSKQVQEKLSGKRIILGLLPYWLVVVIFAIAKLWTIGVNIPAMLAATDVKFAWPGLHGNLVDSAGNPSASTIFNLQWLSSPGTMLLITGLIVTIVYAASASQQFPATIGSGLRVFAKTVFDLRLTILTIMAVMALAYVMNFSGQTVAIGTWLAQTGTAFALVSPVLGWIGTAVTGSATSAGALFGNLQSTAATNAGLSTPLLLGANEIGGGIGKIISPQNLAIAATAIKTPGSEAELLRKALPWSIGLLVILGLLITLASLGPLSFLIVE
ncbi:L-lactate permease [Arcanobacterium hippocoleae]|uniref:L-lactate permease n=1 Tax=Arcanobacterium hippocoleae TaxID=149017 RepID=A0ABU1T0R2_9ACTO|nr:L-lactate permease [Arcanobacterium hippocoleae]MDR6938963.1 lactate permease [Arcanobacterium hippocoleae]